MPLLSADSAPTDALAIDGDAWSLLCKVDGVRSVGALARDTGLTVSEAVTVVHGLVVAGLLEIEEAGPVAEAPSGADRPDERPVTVAGHDDVAGTVSRVSAALSSVLGPSRGLDDVFTAHQRPARPATAVEPEDEALAARRAEREARDAERRERDAEELAAAHAELEAARAAQAAEVEALPAQHSAVIVDLDARRESPSRPRSTRPRSTRPRATAALAGRAEQARPGRAEPRAAEPAGRAGPGRGAGPRAEEAPPPRSPAAEEPSPPSRSGSRPSEQAERRAGARRAGRRRRAARPPPTRRPPGPPSAPSCSAAYYTSADRGGGRAGARARTGGRAGEEPDPAWAARSDTDTASLLRELSSLGLDDEPVPSPRPASPPRAVPPPVKKRKGLFGR